MKPFEIIIASNDSNIFVKLSGDVQGHKTFTLISTVSPQNAPIDPYETDNDTYALFTGYYNEKYKCKVTYKNSDYYSDEIKIEELPNRLKLKKAIGPKVSLHQLYDNVTKYRLEVCFTGAGGYDQYYSDPKNVVKYTLKRVFSDEILAQKTHIRDNFTNYYYVENDISDKQKIAVAQHFDTLPYVKWSSVTPIKYLPPNFDPINYDDTNPKNDEPIDPLSSTPNFQSQQTYLNDFTGLNVLRAWNESRESGRYVTLRYTEWGIFPHEDLQNVKIRSQSTSEPNHGVSSFGIMAGTDNNIGVRGIAHGAISVHYEQGDIATMAADALPGDICGMAVQYSFGGTFLPPTAIRAHWELSRSMIERGAIVIHPAGNGGANLNTHPSYARFGDNGTMLAGACIASNGRRVNFSNFGQTTLINAWGDWSVTTTGRGFNASNTLFDGNPSPTRVYRRDYSGTSAAAPQCIAASGVVQGRAIRQYGRYLNAFQLRTLLQSFGFNQGVQDLIGHRPNTNWMLLNIRSVI